MQEERQQRAGYLQWGAMEKIRLISKELLFVIFMFLAFGRRQFCLFSLASPYLPEAASFERENCDTRRARTRAINPST